MVSEQDDNKALVRRWFDEVVSAGNMDTLDAICQECHPMFAVIKGIVEPAPTGIPGLKGLISQIRQAIPDLTARSRIRLQRATRS